jgi:diguanylate cyclase (GGDEF)-like protein
MLRRARWLLLLMAGLLVALLVMTLRRGAQLRSGADQAARERRMLETVHRTLRQATEESRRMARADTLTGSLNRETFAHELETMLAHGQRLSRPVALMVIDLDRFKEINDRHGHLAGDAALGLAVNAMRQQLDEGMLIGRYGGDEFLVACFDRTREQSLQLAERIRTQVRARSAESDEPALRGITLSIGVALARPGRPHAVEALFQRADAALYAAKKAGRDRVDLADEAAN